MKMIRMALRMPMTTAQRRRLILPRLATSGQPMTNRQPQRNQPRRRPSQSTPIYPPNRSLTFRTAKPPTEATRKPPSRSAKKSSS